jgi:hypothetical protein
LDDEHYKSTARDALSAAEHALALDPNNGEALGVEAMLTPTDRLMVIDRLFERALHAEPNNTQLLNWYSSFLTLVGREGEALESLRRAYELDRLTPVIAVNLASTLLREGFVDESRRILELNRDNRQANFFYVRTYDLLLRHDWRGLAGYLSTMPGDLAPAEKAFFQLARETAVAFAERNQGKFAALRARWRQEGLRYDHNYVAQFLTALDDPNAVLDLIEQGVPRKRSIGLMDSPVWEALFVPNLAVLRRDPRVPALLAKWGLFDYWRTSNNWPDFCDEPGLPFDCKAEARKFSRKKA